MNLVFLKQLTQMRNGLVRLGIIWNHFQCIFNKQSVNMFIFLI